MKWWHAVLGIIAVVVISGFVVPPSIRCKFMIWDKNACGNVQDATKLLSSMGVDINPNEPILTQLGEIEGTPVNRF